MKTALAGLGSTVASLMFVWAMVHRYFPSRFGSYLANQSRRLFYRLYPYIHIKFPEYTGERMHRNEAYAFTKAYLTATCSRDATKLNAEIGRDSKGVVLSMDDNEEVIDEFHGAKLWWASIKVAPRTQTVSFYPAPDERRYYKLTFHKRHRDLVVGTYLDHVVREGKEARARNRQRKLYTNNSNAGGVGRAQAPMWSNVVFEHPATFDTLAMDPDKKRDIVADLDTFRKGKDYYAKIGKAWKRGYLLYGPPGTGKSTMIAAIANYLGYDVYDLELTTVKTNTDLRKLLIETNGKSIIVIEDIDCSLNLAGKRREKPRVREGPAAEAGEERDEGGSKVTLSGLLNFIDGLWSACGGERLIVFTTNHVEKLDPALVRRGRMDKHIEMSFCTFEAFRVLAGNYLGIAGGADHPLFNAVRVLMEGTSITPADVAEHLMPKSDEEDAGTCLQSLIRALEAVKVEEEAKGRSGEDEKKVGE